MDLDLSEDQRAILEGVTALLARRCEPARSIELLNKGEYDHELDAALADAGFYELAIGDQTGLLEAVFLVESVARAGGRVSAGASAIVAPALTGRMVPGPVALAPADARFAVRFAQHARTLVVDEGDRARSVAVAPGDADPVSTNFMVPLGRFRAFPAGGQSLGAGSGGRLRALWRLALAAEALGAMRGAFELTLDYVKRRRQFGRAIGSFQAVQHRMSEVLILVEGSRWLTYEAAARGAEPEASALAASHALTAADRLFREMHQFSGAMGFTDDQRLHLWTMPLQALRLELGGPAAHGREAAQLRWPPPPPRIAT